MEPVDGAGRWSKLGERIRAHKRLHGSLRSPRDVVPGRSKTFFLWPTQRNGHRRHGGWSIPGAMARTLFDDSDATRHDEGVASRRRRVAIIPVRLTKGERDQLADVAR